MQFVSSIRPSVRVNFSPLPLLLYNINFIEYDLFCSLLSSHFFYPFLLSCCSYVQCLSSPFPPLSFPIYLYLFFISSLLSVHFLSSHPPLLTFFHPSYLFLWCHFYFFIWFLLVDAQFLIL